MRLRPFHLCLAVLVAAVWGVNFVVIEIGLRHFPPLLFSGLRFLVAALPALFFVRRPRVAFRWVVAVGLVLGVAKFGLLFLGMRQGMPAGLSSLVLQVQAVFTAVLATVFLRERLGRTRLFGMAVALGGIAVAAIGQGTAGPLGAFALVIVAAACWGVSNVLTRHAAPPEALSWMVWVSAIPPIPLLLLSLVFEGPTAATTALTSLTWEGTGAVLYVAWITTLLGFGIWGFLLRHYDASAVAPFSLLVPVFGVSSAALLLGERFSGYDAAAGLLLVAGVALISLAPGRRAPRSGQQQVALPPGDAARERPIVRLRDDQNRGVGVPHID